MKKGKLKYKIGSDVSEEQSKTVAYVLDRLMGSYPKLIREPNEDLLKLADDLIKGIMEREKE